MEGWGPCVVRDDTARTLINVTTSKRNASKKQNQSCSIHPELSFVAVKNTRNTVTVVVLPYGTGAAAGCGLASHLSISHAGNTWADQPLYSQRGCTRVMTNDE